MTETPEEQSQKAQESGHEDAQAASIPGPTPGREGAESTSQPANSGGQLSKHEEDDAK